jgi:hypothetical protein
MKVFVHHEFLANDRAISHYLTARLKAAGLEAWNVDFQQTRPIVDMLIETEAELQKTDAAVFIVSPGRSERQPDLLRTFLNGGSRLRPCVAITCARVISTHSSIERHGVHEITWFEEDDEDAKFWDVYCQLTGTAKGPVDDWSRRGRAAAPEFTPPLGWTFDNQAFDRVTFNRRTRLGIFISYRRWAEGYAGRIYDNLASELPTLPLFMDVASISPGEDFSWKLERVLAQCFSMIVVIDPEWATARDRRWRRLIHRDRDVVRMEVKTGLDKMSAVLPVLVGGAVLPTGDDLPRDLKFLPANQAIDLRHTSWHDDMNRLVKAIRKYAVWSTARYLEP